MEDGRLPGEMTLDGIAKRLDAIDARLGGLEAETRSGFTRVDEKLNEAKIRDEELHGLLKFSLEAREGLRESMEQRFDAMGDKHDQEIGLLKDVVRHVTGTRANG